MKSSAKARRQRDDRAYAEFEAMMRRLAKASRRDIEGVTSPTRSHRADRPNRRIAGQRGATPVGRCRATRVPTRPPRNGTASPNARPETHDQRVPVRRNCGDRDCRVPGVGAVRVALLAVTLRPDLSSARSSSGRPAAFSTGCLR